MQHIQFSDETILGLIGDFFLLRTVSIFEYCLNKCNCMPVISSLQENISPLTQFYYNDIDSV